MSEREITRADEQAAWKRQAQDLDLSFSVYDKNGNGVLSRGELLHTEAPFKFLQEFNDIAKMATNISTEPWYRNKAVLNEYVGDKHADSEGISRQDLRVLQVVADPKGIERKLDEFRQDEIVHGLKDTSIGLASTVGAIVAGTFGRTPGTYLAAGLGTVAINRFGNAGESFFFSQRDSLRAAYEQRQKMLEDW